MAGFTVLSVSQLNQYIKSLLESDSRLDSVYLRGEISNFTNHYSSGHLYFTLKDAGAAIKAVMFKSAAAYLKFRPENGMSVIVQGRVSLYPRDGVYQVYVNDMQPDGAGALAIAFEQLKRRLDAEGLFAAEHKKEIPSCPAKIGIITSKTGAVLQDIRNVLTRRFPAVEAELYPVQVQGSGAHRQIIKALQWFDVPGRCDVVILARGGGSMEDLWCFNEEELARAIYACRVPVISAVGHETDFTIADFVADLRAPTPTAAAELAVPDGEELRYRIAAMQSGMELLVRTRLENYRQVLAYFHADSMKRNMESRIAEKHRRLNELKERLEQEKDRSLENAWEKVRTVTRLLDSVSPTGLLLRGYTSVSKDGKAVTSAAALKPGDRIRLRFADGEVSAEVTAQTLNNTGDR